VADFQAVFYRDASSREPAREFLDSLDDDSQAAIEHQIGRLNLLSDATPHLPFPHSSQVASRRSGGRTSERAWTRSRASRLVPPVTTRHNMPVVSHFC